MSTAEPETTRPLDEDLDQDQSAALPRRGMRGGPRQPRRPSTWRRAMNQVQDISAGVSASIVPDDHVELDSPGSVESLARFFTKHPRARLLAGLGVLTLAVGVLVLFWVVVGGRG